MTEMGQATRTRERTRRSLLAAGTAELIRRPGATMGDIADAAGVSRSTLHRYFPDRVSLETAIDDHVESVYHAAIDAARFDDGTGLVAFERLLGEMLDRLDAFAWWMRSAHDEEDDDTDGDRRVRALLERGQQDGSIDRRLPPDWILMSVWSALWAVHFQISRSRSTARELREVCLLGLLKMVRA